MRVARVALMTTEPRARTTIRNFRDLQVWQFAMDLTLEVHRAAALLPAEQRFELARELRRSAVSIPSNIAEGFVRHSRPSYRLHVAIALGSTAELETQIEIAVRLAYV